MIELGALASQLSELTGDAVKVAIVLMDTERASAHLRADVAWRERVGRTIVLSPAVIEKALRELADAELISLTRRVEISRSAKSMSEPPGTLAFCSTPVSPSTETENETESPKASGAANGTSREATRDVSGEQKPRRSQPRAETRQALPDAAPVDDALAHLGQGQPASGLALELARTLEQQRAAEQLNGDVRAAIDVFDRLYREANDGAKPTWGERPFASMRTLVQKHGRDEVCKRIEIMFTAPPRWPAPPYDLASLVQHFDKFAKPSTNRGGMVDRWRGGENYYGDVTEVKP